MATEGVLTVIGVIGICAVLFEVTVMRSPAAGLGPFGVLNGIVEFFSQLLIQKLSGP